MNKGRFVTRNLWVVSILWMCFCLYLSWQTGKDTVTLSKAAAQTVRRVILVFGMEIDLNSLHMWMRKSAHVATFFVSGVLFFFSFKRSLKGRHASLYSFVFAVVLCSACAVAAEAGKIWIPGRHLHWTETILDVAGVACGAGIAAEAHVCLRKLWKHPD